MSIDQFNALMVFGGTALIFAVFTIPPFVAHINKVRKGRKQLPELTYVGKAGFTLWGMSMIFWGLLLTWILTTCTSPTY